MAACADKRSASKKEKPVAEETGEATSDKQTSGRASTNKPSGKSQGAPGAANGSGSPGKATDKGDEDEVLGVSGSHLAPPTGEVVPEASAPGSTAEKSAGSGSSTASTSNRMNKPASSGSKVVDPSLFRHEMLQKMLEARDTGVKISFAGKYFDAFEFQLWSTEGRESEDRRMELATSAMRDFLRDLHEFLRPGQKETNPLLAGNPGETDADNRERCVNVLASMMHVIHEKQARLLVQDKELKELSIYSMIQEALRARVEIATNGKKSEDFPSYVKEVLADKDAAVLLLQARFNHDGAMALNWLSPIQESGMNYVKAWLWAWELDLESKELEEVIRVSRLLKTASSTRDFMLSVGIHPVLESRIRDWFGSKMSLSEATSNRVKRLREQPAGTELSAKDAAALELLDVIKDYSGPSVRLVRSTVSQGLSTGMQNS